MQIMASSSYDSAHAQAIAWVYCLGVGRYKSDTDQKYHLYRNVDATQRETFKQKFLESNGLMLLLIRAQSRETIPRCIIHYPGS